MRTLHRMLRRWLWVVFAIGATIHSRGAGREEAWLKVTMPEFTVITSLKEKEARAWTTEFAQYLAALRDNFRIERMRLPRLTLVIFARERDFERYRPLDAGGRPQEVAGFFCRNESWAVAGLAGTEMSDLVRHVVFHEGVHWFFSGSDRTNPVWLEEGLAEVFATFRVNGRQAEWGRLIEEHVQLLRQNRGLSLEQVLHTARDELFSKDPVATSLVYAGSWVFAHFMIYGQHKIPRRAISDYADGLHKGQAPDAAFREAFGMTYKEMDALLWTYLQDGRYFVSRRDLLPVAEPKLERAATVEVQDALARLAFGGHRWAMAKTHARALAEAAPSDPRGHELLGLALKQEGDAEGSLAEFKRAVDHGSIDFMPYFEVGLAGQQALTDATGVAPAAIDPKEARRVADCYERAINLYPRFKLSYQNLAGVVGVAEPSTEHDRDFLELGRKLYPQDAMIQVGLATLLRRKGDRTGARELVEAVLKAQSDGSANAIAFARRLDGAWEQEDIFQELTRLADTKDYRAALAEIDRRLEKGVSGLVRTQLLPMRRQLEAAALSQEVESALSERRWAEARRLLEQIINSDGAVALKQQARRTLEDLDRRKLGLPETVREP